MFSPVRNPIPVQSSFCLYLPRFRLPTFHCYTMRVSNFGIRILNPKLCTSKFEDGTELRRPYWIVTWVNAYLSALRSSSLGTKLKYLCKTIIHKERATWVNHVKWSSLMYWPIHYSESNQGNGKLISFRLLIEYLVDVWFYPHLISYF